MRELSLHILDLVQNAMEAKATSVDLTIIEDTKNKDCLLIKVSDNGQGMDANTSRQVLDPFVTSRTTRRVGLGLPLIDMTSKRCDGYMEIVSAVGQGTSVTAYFKHSHIDRPPLGNMVATLKGIIIANPGLDFHYHHSVNNQEFAFHSKEIIDMLGDIPLSHHAVLEWLDAYLSQNLLNLYGGGESENN